MGSLSIWHWLVVLVVVVLIFGTARLPQAMGDLSKGIKAFKKNMKEEDETPPPSQVADKSGHQA